MYVSGSSSSASASISSSSASLDRLYTLPSSLRRKRTPSLVSSPATGSSTSPPFATSNCRSAASLPRAVVRRSSGVSVALPSSVVMLRLRSVQVVAVSGCSGSAAPPLNSMAKHTRMDRIAFIYITLLIFLLFKSETILNPCAYIMQETLQKVN